MKFRDRVLTKLEADRRREALRKAVESWIDLDENYSGAEDANALLESPTDPLRYVILTTAGGETNAHTYIKTADNVEGAKALAVEYCTDDIYMEFPVAIIDLDTGIVVRPDWSLLAWKPAS